MLIHGNARLLPREQSLLCERVRLEGWTVDDAADAFGVLGPGRCTVGCVATTLANQ